jgi:hypothetical protein
MKLSRAGCLPIGLVDRSSHRLGKGAPNRNPERESKRRAPGQEDADDNSAMPTASRRFYHWFRGTKVTV